MIEYPYMLSNNKISQIFDKIKGAAVPERFTVEFLRKLGFTSTNDRAFIPLLKKLGFLTADGVPTEYYSQLKETKFGFVLAERVKELYVDLFLLDTSINTAQDPDIRGAIGRVTGKDDLSVSRYMLTFKALLPLCNFTEQPEKIQLVKDGNKRDDDSQKTKQPYIKQEMVDFHYDIQIHLPATTDINIYNAIFKSIKDNLLDQ